MEPSSPLEHAKGIELHSKSPWGCLVAPKKFPIFPITFEHPITNQTREGFPHQQKSCLYFSKTYLHVNLP
jgi:hypothetical protein